VNGPLDTVLWLLERGADINAQAKWRSTALHFAAYSPRPEAVQVLLEHGADININDNKRRTALQMALQYGRAETARILTEHTTRDKIEHPDVFIGTTDTIRDNP